MISQMLSELGKPVGTRAHYQLGHGLAINSYNKQHTQSSITNAFPMTSKFALVIVFLMALLVGNSIRAVAYSAEAVSVEESSRRLGLPEELLSVAELNNLSSVSIAERLRLHAAQPQRYRAPAPVRQKVSIISQPCRVIRAIMKYLSLTAIDPLYVNSSTHFGVKDETRRLVVLSPQVTNISPNRPEPQHKREQMIGCSNGRFPAQFRLYMFFVLSFAAWIVTLGRGEMLMARVRFERDIQRQNVTEAAAVINGLTTQVKELVEENSALKSGLKRLAENRDSLELQVRRITFERENFKDSLRQTMKLSRQMGTANSRFSEDIDILGQFAEREWNLKQELAGAKAERVSVEEEAKAAKAAVKQLQHKLDLACYDLDVEKQKTANLREDRDLYVKFAKLSSVEKKRLARTLAECNERRSGEVRKLDRRVLKLMDCIVETNAQFEERYSEQHRLILVLKEAMSSLGECIMQNSIFAADIQGNISRCNALAHSVALSLDAHRGDVEHCMSRIQILSEIVARFVLSMPSIEVQGELDPLGV